MESIDTTQEMDEIKTYLDYRYISATEACWRIFQFDIHYRKPAVERLPFHLLGEHTVIFKESKCLQNVLTIPGIEKTKFTEWLEANKIYDDVRELTYSDFPTCWVSDASQLWKSNYTTLSEDITSLQRKRFRLKDLQLTEQQVEAYTLLEIETIMLKMGKSLRDIDGMPLPNSSLIRDSGNRLVNEELDYDRDQLKKLHEKSFAALNACQKSAYEAIMHSVENEKGHLFFINGHGGIGKTFLWNTIIAKLISHSKIVLPVATSVVPKGTRADIVDASLNSSYLWPFFKIYKLKQNMRLYNGSVSGSEAAKIASFDKWLLQIGDGSLYDDIDRDLVKLPSDICKKTIRKSDEINSRHYLPINSA
ncbi:hypothetical protein WN943_018600 [Citrus x changshan-huyou]